MSDNAANVTANIRQHSQETISDKYVSALANSIILVTGATGLVGGNIVRSIADAKKAGKLNITILASGRNTAKGDKLCAETGAIFIPCELAHPHAVNKAFAAYDRIDYIFHCAAITKSAEMTANPVEVMTTAVDGTRNLLELARQKQCKSFVYLSSMEVYGQYDGVADEKELGYIDLSNPRSCYPESKRYCEVLCNAYAREYDLPVRIARLAQTFGAGTPKDDTRVFAQFARSAVDKSDIILHTRGQSYGNYCETTDTVRALLTILLCGNDGEAYNVAAESMTIREVAQLVAKVYGVGVKEEIPDRDLGYAPQTGLILDASKMKALGWKPQYGVKDMFARMIADWRS